MVGQPVVFPCAGDPAGLPDCPAVYLIHPHSGRPYLGRTSVLRRRMTRLFAKWDLARIAGRVDYWPTASRLEQWLVSYHLGKLHFPDDYRLLLRLPRPCYVKLLIENEFPRTQVTARLSGGRSLYFGPFPSRAAADQFEAQFLELFQLRRCQEDLSPSLSHPGCIYGEMRKCLRPCQQAVTVEEYASEASRVETFLRTRGASLLATAEAARDRLSSELDFEQAAREHSRSEKIQQIVRLAGELASEFHALHGVAITESAEPSTVKLWFLLEGLWIAPVDFPLAAPDGKPTPLDARLRAIVTGIEPVRAPASTRQEHLALLAKWCFSSWRDGEWLRFENLASIPYRKLVNAVHRVAQAPPTA